MRHEPWGFIISGGLQKYEGQCGKPNNDNIIITIRINNDNRSKNNSNNDNDNGHNKVPHVPHLPNLAIWKAKDHLSIIIHPPVKSCQAKIIPKSSLNQQPGCNSGSPVGTPRRKSHSTCTADSPRAHPVDRYPAAASARCSRSSCGTAPRRPVDCRAQWWFEPIPGIYESLETSDMFDMLVMIGLWGFSSQIYNPKYLSRRETC